MAFREPGRISARAAAGQAVLSGTAASAGTCDPATTCHDAPDHDTTDHDPADHAADDTCDDTETAGYCTSADRAGARRSCCPTAANDHHLAGPSRGTDVSSPSGNR